MELSAYLADRQKKIDRALDRFLPKETAKPTTIAQNRTKKSVAG